MCSVWLYPFALIHIEELGKNSSDIFRSDAEVGIFSGHLQSSSVFYSLSFFALFSLLFFFFVLALSCSSGPLHHICVIS